MPMSYLGTKRRVFISFHHADKAEVDNFLYEFSTRQKVFTAYSLGVGNNDSFINSTNTEYVMSQIRAKYVDNGTVSIVLIGGGTHSRRYVDWEIKASLTRPANGLPNGLIGILLPSMGGSGHLPERLKENWNKDHLDCYARYQAYPSSGDILGRWIDDAHAARTQRAHLITNQRDKMGYNGKCKVHQETH